MDEKSKFDSAVTFAEWETMALATSSEHVARVRQLPPESGAIENSDAYAIAVQDLKDIKKQAKAIDDARKRFTDPISKQMKAIKEHFDASISDLKERQGRVEVEINAWLSAEEQRQHRQQQAELEAAEARRKKLESQAEKAESKGQDEKAADLRDAAERAVAPIVEDTVPKVSGVGVKGVRFEFVIRRPDDVPRELCSPDSGLIRLRVNALGLNAKIPGVLVQELRRITTR